MFAMIMGGHWFSRYMVMWLSVSLSSSKVPMPPGRTMKASAMFMSFSFLSSMVSTSISLVMPRWACSFSMNMCGMMPVICPLADIAVSAMSPMRPMLPPP